MNGYPKLGAMVWALHKTKEYTTAIPVQVVGVDHSAGKVVLRWRRPGIEIELKRKPEYTWDTEEEARDALWKLQGPWRRLGGVQLNFFTRGEGRG